MKTGITGAVIKCALMLGLAACAIGGAAAQSGRITGMVVDATGAVLPGATVALSDDPDPPRQVQVDAGGRFKFARLAPGTYTIIVSRSGFGTVRLEEVLVGTDPVDLPPITLRLAPFEDAVVVTATRTEEPLQQVPMSVSAVTGDEIQQRAIGNLTELARWTPGLTVVDQGARGSNVVIARGLNTDSLNGSEFTGNNYNNGVATYLGDIPLAVDLRLSDIERVEVLLGPQGTLYGAGTLAGAVRYLPRRPDTEQGAFEVRGDLFALAHGGAPGTDAGLTFNLPLVFRKLALRGSVDRYADPGFIDYDYENQALIRPDTTTNYEIGMRRSWREGRFSAAGTLFHVDWKDIQVAGLTPFSSQPITLNGGGAVSRGIEFAGVAGVTNALSLRGSWSYTRAELSRDSPGLLDGGADAFKGDRLSGAPRHQGSLLASHTTLLGDRTLLRLLYGYTYVGDVLTRIGLRAGGETLPAYDLHNLSASLSRNDWTLTFYADNLLDEYAVTGVRQTPGLIARTRDGFRSRRYFANVLTPRRVGVRIRYTLW